MEVAVPDLPAETPLTDAMAHETPEPVAATPPATEQAPAPDTAAEPAVPGNQPGWFRDLIHGLHERLVRLEKDL